MLNLRKSKAKKATFHSYIGDSQNDSYLLSDECEVKRATNVHQESLFINGRSGHVGTLIVTNYRVLFQPLLEDKEQVNTRHYKLRGDYDLELCNISTIYQVVKGRKRKLSINGGGLSHVKHIEIRCKNLMTQSYNLKATDKQEVKLILLALLHHIKPNNLTLLFCFDFKTSTNLNNLYRPSLEYRPQRVDYNRRNPWNRRLAETCARGFKTVDCNIDFKMCPTYPKCFVIPEVMSIEDIQIYNGQFTDHRVPVWCYSHQQNSTSLCRMGTLIDDPGISDSMSRFISCTMKSCPEINGVEQINLDHLIPFSIYDLRKSHKSLKSICMPGSMKDLHNTDLHWFAKLEDTRWLQIISSCLSLASVIVHKMVDLKTSVIVSETSCSDFTPVITCLVQLLLDPTLRSSRILFQEMIDREWTAMGHQFKERYALTLSDNTNSKPEVKLALESNAQSPLFLLFMDCVSQLLVQFPTKFDFSETLLVTICDCVCSGLYSQFIFNNEKHRASIMAGNAEMMSAWQWFDIINSADNINLFNNPLYDANVDGRRKKNNSQDFQVNKPPKPPRKLLRQKYIQTLGAEFMPSYSIDFKFDQVLKVDSTLSSLQFWSYYFLRWLTPMQINCGGGASEYLQRCIRSDEISALRERIARLEDSLEYLDPVGGGDNRDTSLSSPALRHKPAERFSRLMSLDLSSSPAAEPVCISEAEGQHQWSRVMSSSFPFASYIASDRSSVTLGAFLASESCYESDGDIVAGDLDDSQRTSCTSELYSSDCGLTSIDTPSSQYSGGVFSPVNYELDSCEKSNNPPPYKPVPSKPLASPCFLNDNTKKIFIDNTPPFPITDVPTRQIHEELSPSLNIEQYTVNENNPLYCMNKVAHQSYKTTPISSNNYNPNVASQYSPLHNNSQIQSTNQFINSPAITPINSKLAQSTLSQIPINQINKQSTSYIKGPSMNDINQTLPVTIDSLSNSSHQKNLIKNIEHNFPSQYNHDMPPTQNQYLPMHVTGSSNISQHTSQLSSCTSMVSQPLTQTPEITQPQSQLYSHSSPIQVPYQTTRVAGQNLPISPISQQNLSTSLVYNHTDIDDCKQHPRKPCVDNLFNNLGWNKK